MNYTIFKSITLICIFNSQIFCNWQWINNGLNNNYPVHTITSSGNYLFAGTNLSGNGSLYYSTNNGNQWFNIFTNSADILSASMQNNFIYMATDKGIYRTKNLGNEWERCFVNNYTFSSVLINDSSASIIACCYFDGTGKIYISTDFGVSWLHTYTLNYEIISLCKNGNIIYAGTNGNGIYKSTNGGFNWSQTSLTDKAIISLSAFGNNLFAGTINNGVFRSSNNGQTWYQSLNLINPVFALASYNNYIFAGIYDSNNFYYSSNNGQNWSYLKDGLPEPEYSSVRAIHITNNYLYIGVSNSNYNGVYRRPLSEIISVLQISEIIPEFFSLSQNFPNPFNPVTKIKFDIAGSRVSQTFLSVYDLLGREVAVLVNQNLKPGVYEVDFNASNYPSGVYFYRLIAGDFAETKKMVLVK